MTKTILAADVRPGDQLVERDGALLSVATVAKSPTGKTVTLTFHRGTLIVHPGPCKVRASARVSLFEPDVIPG